ncbi:hypothetical protein Taro_050438 [Colocasia esculenta]|uniref:Secreted protein n=1 Tax=Colocasia esculenta TaxID=4460 RepID=A0A843XDY0_COLES|nr:hypothetical protein [Colocasia esculenta]
MWSAGVVFLGLQSFLAYCGGAIAGPFVRGYEAESLVLYGFWGSFPTEPVTCEAHPYPFQVRESRRLLFLHLVRSRTIAKLGLYHQQCNLYFLFTSGYAPVCTFCRQEVDDNLIAAISGNGCVFPSSGFGNPPPMVGFQR